MNPGLRADSDWEESVASAAPEVNGVFRPSKESFGPVAKKTSPALQLQVVWREVRGGQVTPAAFRKLSSSLA
jgi:hypothetical protein